MRELRTALFWSAPHSQWINPRRLSPRSTFEQVGEGGPRPQRAERMEYLRGTHGAAFDRSAVERVLAGR